MTTMPVLTVRQPWPWAMFSLTPSLRKDVENRTWATKHRGPILIHASRAFRIKDVRRDFSWLTERLGLELPESDAKTFKAMRAQTGGIVGVVTIKDCVQNNPSPWAMDDHWHWVLADARPLPFWPCKGRLGIWRVDYPHEIPQTIKETDQA